MIKILTKNHFKRLVLNPKLNRNYSEYIQTSDSKEIEHFQKFVDDWWNPNGVFKGLHLFNNYRVPYVQNKLKNLGLLKQEFVNTSKPLQNLNIIDVGCGAGLFCEPIAALGANVTGLDAAEDVITCAKIHASKNPEIKNSITYVSDTLENIIGNNKNKFDAVVSFECVEHVTCPETFLKSCIEVLKPGGLLVLSTWNRTMFSWFYAIILCEYIFSVIPKGTHDWNKFIIPREIQNLLEKYNCQVNEVQGIRIKLNSEWSFRSSTSLNYFISAVKK